MGQDEAAMPESRNESTAQRIRASGAFVKEVMAENVAEPCMWPSNLQRSLAIESLLAQVRARALPLEQLPPRIRGIPFFRPAFIARFVLRAWNYVTKAQRDQSALLCDCIEALEIRLRSIESDGRVEE